MNPARFALRKRTVTVVLSLILAVVGIKCYLMLGRLENPDFVIKIAVVTTRYPGASPEQVEQEVTDVLEDAIQSMGELDEIWSVSQEGLSVIYAEMDDSYTSKDLPQIWDKLRRKVGDNQYKLPRGAGPSVVNDDFGDVYGLYYAITGENRSYEELKDYGRDLKKELLLCDDVAKIAFWGVQTEAIYIEMEPTDMSELGISPQQIIGVLQSQDIVQQSGKVRVGEDYVRITPTGDFTSEDQIGETLITSPVSGASFRLRDIATIRRDYVEPPWQVMRFNGKPAIGMGVSTVAGGNAVTMSNAVKERMAELESLRPKGMNAEIIYDQGGMVNEAVNGFVLNLVESVVIVIVLLVLFMGWRSGLLIGGVLLLTILTTFIYMWMNEISLQKISLGALILALGMLVDNAIVVTEGILIKIQKGVDRRKAAEEVVAQTQWPLLGATFIAILAFAAIGYAPGNVGEFCRSLFWVLGASLLFSWVFAVTLTPLLCVWLLPSPKPGKAGAKELSANPYDRLFFRVYRLFLHKSLRYWPVTLVALVVTVVAAGIAFQNVPSSFFPGSTQPHMLVEYWRPQGTHIDETNRDLAQIEQFIMDQEGVVNASGYVGQSTLRFLLSYDAKDPNSGFGQILVTAEDYQQLAGLREKVNAYISDNFHDAEWQIQRFQNGPPLNYKIEAKFRGPDRAVLRDLSEQTQEIMRRFPTRDVRDNWRNQVSVLRPSLSEQISRQTGISRQDVSNALQMNYGGIPVGAFREDEDQIPLIVRSPGSLHDTYTDARRIQLWSPALNRSVPLEQVVDDWDSQSTIEDSLIRRRYRVREITAQCNPRSGLASVLFADLKPVVEREVTLPPGYTLEWGGEYEASNDAQEPLAFMFPICLAGMFIILICLFNSIRNPIVIFLCLPLIVVGVAFGLLLLQLPFGFMAILGFLGLSGMLIKNAIVLIDEIELDRAAGEPPYQAVLDAGVSRLRPVVMAAGTTVLGMIPLLWDPFFNVMAATVGSGLIGSTALTLTVVPLFYILIFWIKPDDKYAGIECMANKGSDDAAEDTDG